MDSVDRSAGSHLDPVRVLHRVISVSNHAEFAFSVPPHQKDARLRGTFRSFTKRGAPDSTSDDTANIDVMVLTTSNWTTFNTRRWPPPTKSTHHTISESSGKPQQRPIRRRRTPSGFQQLLGGAKTKFVQADFSVTFE